MGFRLASLFVDIEMRQGNFDSSVRGLTGALGALVSFTQRAAVAGSDLYETMNKVDVTFGSSSQTVKQLANDMANQFGTVKNITLDTAAQFGLIGQAAGMTEAESAGLATSFVRLADDASSFFNKPMDVVLAKLQSGLTGQARPLREFGVLLSKSAVDAEAASMGFEKVGGQYSEQEKVMARVEIITRGLAKAQGDHERTMDSYVNTIRKVKGEMENYTTLFGAGVAAEEAKVITKLFDKGPLEALYGLLSDVKANLTGTGDTEYQRGADVAAGVQRGRAKNQAEEVNMERVGKVSPATEKAAKAAVDRANAEIERANLMEKFGAESDYAVRSIVAELQAEQDAITEVEEIQEAIERQEQQARKHRRINEGVFAKEKEELAFLFDFLDIDIPPRKHNLKEEARAENEFMQGFLGLDIPAAKREKVEAEREFRSQSMGVAEFAAKLRMEQKGGDVPQKQLTELQQIRKSEMEAAKSLAKLAERGFPAVLA